MQVTRYPFVVLLFGAILLSSGCESIDSRIRQHEATFTGLPQKTQQRLMDGEIRRGDRSDMVYIAFGKPTHREAIITSGGRNREVWTYTKKRHVKEESRLVTDQSEQGRLAVEEVYRVYVVKLREITFLDDRVVHIDDPQTNGSLVASLTP